MLNFAKKGYVGYAASVIIETKKNRNISKKLKKTIFNIIFTKSIKFPAIKHYNYLTKKDFIFNKFINKDIKKN